MNEEATRKLIESLDNERWRGLLLQQLERTEATSLETFKKLRDAINAAERVGFGKSDLCIKVGDARRLLEIGMLGKFAIFHSWEDVGTAILVAFWSLRHPSFAEVIARCYEDARDRARAYGLVILALQDDAGSAEHLAGLLERHGVPKDAPPRLFWELNGRHVALAPRLLPKILQAHGDSLSDVMNYTNLALEKGAITRQVLAPLRDAALSAAERLLGQAAAMQQDTGTEWRTVGAYPTVRLDLGVYLDLLRHMPDAPADVFARAFGLADPRLILFAIGAALEHGHAVPAEAIQRCAQSLETRAALFKQLSLLGREDLFPVRYRSFESFAACDMVAWLLYPGELGYEPPTIELAATVKGESQDGRTIHCLWKFTDQAGEAFAAVSGPYPDPPPEGPVSSGGDTFSNFTPWDALTPEQHLAGIAETLESWRMERCSL